ncbi:MAG: hypothetical protein CMP57_00535 [Flavobacteriales bacterium]|nr:hypothetical protein [Flavobacteriales bacterium]
MDIEKSFEDQVNNPMHGIKLVEILEYLYELYGWNELGDRLGINCFLNKPTFKSSLKFLRKTPWARDKVESLYLSSNKQSETIKT